MDKQYAATSFQGGRGERRPHDGDRNDRVGSFLTWNSAGAIMGVLTYSDNIVAGVRRPGPDRSPDEQTRRPAGSRQPAIWSAAERRVPRVTHQVRLSRGFLMIARPHGDQPADRFSGSGAP